MFDPVSRYATMATLQHANPDGSTTAYAALRILPQRRDLQILGEVAVVAGERLDVLAARALGEATLFWRLCDANDASDPEQLLGGPGQRLLIPLPQR